ncbi:hypothetical protein HMPREF0083_03594 [Aneurinibacillus aneurinilyticus ATCC 12856]|uniref:Uncharacterized protein n=1 Tax=Aneurinibacillus aneurinilyticus ATCC 12856 TaxID=649747 RepID=U1Y841_ANEAE|nr:hypothetical protein HMPREF0083_03594 [Aneurinibacillus aneurinilyticus ATCC 12856]
MSLFYFLYLLMKKRVFRIRYEVLEYIPYSHKAGHPLPIA